jgi:hypothetical protein
LVKKEKKRTHFKFFKKFAFKFVLPKSPKSHQWVLLNKFAWCR